MLVNQFHLDVMDRFEHIELVRNLVFFCQLHLDIAQTLFQCKILYKLNICPSPTFNQWLIEYIGAPESI